MKVKQNKAIMKYQKMTAKDIANECGISIYKAKRIYTELAKTKTQYVTYKQFSEYQNSIRKKAQNLALIKKQA